MLEDPAVTKRFEAWAKMEARKKKYERIVGNIALLVVAALFVLVGFVLGVSL